MQLRQQLQAINARHANITDHHALPVRLNQLGNTPRIGKRDDLQSGQIKGLAQGLTQVWIIINQQHLSVSVEAGHVRVPLQATAQK